MAQKHNGGKPSKKKKLVTVRQWVVVLKDVVNIIATIVNLLG